jgi:hypothetical protein
MRSALTSYLPCPDRSYPVTAPYCQWHEYASRYTRHERQKRCQRQKTTITRLPGVVMTGNMIHPPRKLVTLIPIALRHALTAWLPTAVSSLEACKTPAR